MSNMIEQPFLSIPAKTACLGKFRLIFNENFRATRIIMKLSFGPFGPFLVFGDSDRLEIAYDGSPKCFSSCGNDFGSCIIN